MKCNYFMAADSLAPRLVQIRGVRVSIPQRLLARARDRAVEISFGEDERIELRQLMALHQERRTDQALERIATAVEIALYAIIDFCMCGGLYRSRNFFYDDLLHGLRKTAVCL